MKQVFFFSILFVLACLFSAQNSHAQSIVYLPSEDVFVDEEQPGLNFNGQQLTLGIQNFGPVSLRKNILVKFDIPPGISTIMNGYIRFYLSTPVGGIFFDEVHIWEITSPWQANSLTWDDMTALGKVEIDTATNVTGASGMQIEIPASLVDNWSANPASNHGIMLEVQSSLPLQTATFTDYENLQSTCTELYFYSANIIPPVAPLILGPDTICSTEGGYFQVYPHTTSINASWTIPSNWTSGISMMYLYEVYSANGSGQICVSLSNSAGSSPIVCKDVVVDIQNSFPGALSGPNMACTGDTIVITLNPTWPNATFIWEYPSDWILLSGAGSTEITLIVGSVTGNVRVKQPDNSCQVNPSASFYPYIIPTPGLPQLTGPVNVLPNSLVTFSAIGTYAYSYLWTLPPGAVILSGDSTGNVQIQFGTQGGNLCVRGVNDCTSGPDNCIAIGIVGQDEQDLVRDIMVIQDPLSPREVIIRNCGIRAAELRLTTGNGLEVSAKRGLPAGREIRFLLPASGLYLLEITAENGQRILKKVVGI